MSTRTTRSRLTLANCQVKSAEKLRAVCRAIDVLEKETFIRSGQIELDNCFICPDIDLLEFYNSKDPTEHLVGKIAILIHVERWGDDARKEYKAVAEQIEAQWKRAKGLHRKHARKR